MATMDWATGTIGPSVSPSTPRATSRKAKPPARPDRDEQTENSSSITSRICLRRRVESAIDASRYPEPATAMERADARSPSWVLEMWNSATM